MVVNDQLHALVALTPGKQHSTHYMGSWMGLRAGLNFVEERKMLPLQPIVWQLY
jgi:hypothetical protein